MKQLFSFSGLLMIAAVLTSAVGCSHLPSKEQLDSQEQTESDDSIAPLQAKPSVEEATLSLSPTATESPNRGASLVQGDPSSTAFVDHTGLSGNQAGKPLIAGGDIKLKTPGRDKTSKARVASTPEHASGSVGHNTEIKAPISQDAPSSYWDHLLQAPTKQGEPILPGKPLDIEREQKLLDALVLPRGDHRAALIGLWQQSNGSNNADFGNGGYSQSFLVFRTDGLVDLVRSFGKDGSIRLMKRYDYIVSAQGIVKLGVSKEYRPRFARQTLTIPNGDSQPIVIAPPVINLPCTLKFSTSKDVLELQGKNYKRVKAPLHSDGNPGH